MCARALILVSIALCAITLGGCGFFGEKPDPTRDWSANRLYTAAKEKLNEGDYDTAVDYYEKLESRYPFGPLAQQAQLEVAYAYYKNDEPASALAAADRFIKLHPQHPSVDYAYYIKGLTNFNKGKDFLDRFLPKDPSERDPGSAQAAFRDFEELVTRFPESRYAADSVLRMQFLKNILARHELHVADWYMRRDAWLAAVNRAKYVVENFQETPSVPDALAVMAKGYKVLELPQLSADALRVLKLNYPDYAGIAEVERLVMQ